MDINSFLTHTISRARRGVNESTPFVAVGFVEDHSDISSHKIILNHKFRDCARPLSIQFNFDVSPILPTLYLELIGGGNLIQSIPLTLLPVLAKGQISRDGEKYKMHFDWNMLMPDIPVLACVYHEIFLQVRNGDSLIPFSLICRVEIYESRQCREFIMTSHRESMQGIITHTIHPTPSPTVDLNVRTEVTSTICKGFIIETPVPLEHCTLLINNVPAFDYSKSLLSIVAKVLGDGLLYIPIHPDKELATRSVDSFDYGMTFRIDKAVLRLRFSAPVETCRVFQIVYGEIRVGSGMIGSLAW